MSLRLWQPAAVFMAITVLLSVIGWQLGTPSIHSPLDVDETFVLAAGQAASTENGQVAVGVTSVSKAEVSLLVNNEEQKLRIGAFSEITLATNTCKVIFEGASPNGPGSAEAARFRVVCSPSG